MYSEFLIGLKSGRRTSGPDSGLQPQGSPDQRTDPFGRPGWLEGQFHFGTLDALDALDRRFHIFDDLAGDRTEGRRERDRGVHVRFSDLDIVDESIGWFENLDGIS